MSIVVPFLILLLVGFAAAYHRLPLLIWVLLTGVSLAAGAALGTNATATIIAAVLIALVALPLLIPAIRLSLITRPLLNFYTRILPPLSDTERTALEAGTVGFEGELFSGKPKWKALLDQPKPELSVEEKAFLDGPCEELCKMVNDWDITHVRADLPPEIWEFVKRNKFFGMIIPKDFGGLGFSALANHKVIQKLASISSTLSSTVGVPNSLGPGELLLHYGTDEQKNHYRGWPMAAKCRASDSPGRSPVRTRPRFRITASSARNPGMAPKWSASG
jgi:acyl-CoA dehydrogenase